MHLIVAKNVLKCIYSLKKKCIDKNIFCKALFYLKKYILKLKIFYFFIFEYIHYTLETS